MLNLTGIIFAIQFVTLLFIGAYADYGKWRPWVMIGEYSFGYVHSIPDQQGSPVYSTAVNSPFRRSTSLDNGLAPRFATLSEYMVSGLNRHVAIELILSHEHGHRLLCRYVPRSSSRSTRGHQVGAGCHGRYCLVSRSRSHCAQATLKRQAQRPMIISYLTRGQK